MVRVSISKSKAEIKKIVVNYCKSRGWQVANAEFYNDHSRKYTDLFGIADLLVIDDINLPGSMMIQITTEEHAREHLDDVLYNLDKRVYAQEWLEKKNRIWYFFFKRNTNNKWKYRIYVLKLSDFDRGNQ